MTCFHPIYVYQSGIKENGKRQLDFSIKTAMIKHKEENTVRIPCGKCLGCRMDYAKIWANRCMLEAKSFKDNYFITLTYNDECIPIKNGLHTLEPKDLQDFFKRIRRYWEYHYNWKKTENNPGIRFYACGEYGDRTQRPHYHALIFNMPIPDKKPLFKNYQEDQIFTSKIIEEIWGKGIISIGRLSWETCAYTARYVMKKQKGMDHKYFKDKGIVPEFVRMSRKPGIGFTYYENNKDKIYETDEIFLSDGKGNVRTAKPPKYFDSLYELENPNILKQVKEMREFMAKYNKEKVLEKSSLTEEQYLKQKENILKKKIEKKKRSSI